jgi:hypothetical protein
VPEEAGKFCILKSNSHWFITNPASFQTI